MLAVSTQYTVFCLRQFGGNVSWPLNDKIYITVIINVTTLTKINSNWTHFKHNNNDCSSLGIHQMVCTVCSPAGYCAFYKQMFIRYVYVILYFLEHKHTESNIEIIVEPHMVNIAVFSSIYKHYMSS